MNQNIKLKHLLLAVLVNYAFGFISGWHSHRVWTYQPPAPAPVAKPGNIIVWGCDTCADRMPDSFEIRHVWYNPKFLRGFDSSLKSE